MKVMTGVRTAARSLLRKPGYAVVGVATLGLGIGSVVAIFAFVHTILIEPLPYPDADRIVEIRHHAPAIDLPNLNNSPGTLAFYRETADFFDAVLAINVSSRVLTGIDQPERILVAMVSPEFFTVFRVQPNVGRPFGDADGQPGAAPVAILLHEAWQNRFGGASDVLGRTLVLDGVNTEIVGVMPAGFDLPQPGPMALVARTRPEPVFGEFGITGLARLSEGVSLDEAQTRLDALQARIPEFDPEVPQEMLDRFGWSASLQTLKETLVEDVETTLWIVLGTVGFVLLIACANVANLFLVRAEGRQKEIAVRAAMGAGRGDIAASFLQESLLLGVAGGLLGVTVAWWGVRLLVTYGPQDVPRLHEVALSPTVLAFAALLSVATGVVLGLLPMSRYRASAFAAVLRDGGRGATTGRGRGRIRSALVMSQLALALVLLVGSGLMYRSFAELRSVDLGFDTDRVLSVGMQVGDGMSRDEAARFYLAMRERVAAMPGVAEAGVTTQVPLESGNWNGGSFYIESRPRQEGDLPPVAMYHAATPGYLESLGIELVEGRPMTEADLDGSRAYVWVNETFARQFLDGDALGERVAWQSSGEEDDPTESDWLEVAGVVRTARYQSLRDEPRPTAVIPMVAGGLPYPELGVGFLTLKAEAGIDPTTLVPAIREEVARLNGQVPIVRAETLEAVVASAMAGDSITLVLLGIAAAMALFLGSIGLFGVISYVVSQRTREIGVRIALGAEAAAVSRMVLRQGVAVAAAGTALGLAGALGLTRLMGSLLYGVTATDPLTFVVAPTVLLAVSVLATWLPARRAARVDPVESLREE